MIHDVTRFCLFVRNYLLTCPAEGMQGRDLLPAERQKERMERIQKDGRVLATDLAREFQPLKTQSVVLCATWQLNACALASMGEPSPYLPPQGPSFNVGRRLLTGSLYSDKRWLRSFDRGNVSLSTQALAIWQQPVQFPRALA
jgi:hypothetical protein